jgi:hypothetical protein
MRTKVIRIFGGAAAAWLALALAACASTKRSPSEDATPAAGASGAEAQPSGGNGGSGTVGGSTGTFAGLAGSAGHGGTSTASGGEGGEGGEGPAFECIEGGLCACGNSTGILDCSGAESSAAGRCVCPPANVCQVPKDNCFEPCGGDALGLWVLEETCFRSSKIGVGCEGGGGALEGTSVPPDLRLEVFENEPVEFIGSESLDIRALVPLQCLGIDSVNRCGDAVFYASPLYFGVSRALACEPNACGLCECSGNLYGGRGSGRPWKPGASTLAFGAIEVPYCVEGDTMWAGGGEVEGEPKVAYKFRRRSCVGKPLACAQRESGHCGTSGDCLGGHCLPDGAEASVCAELFFENHCVHQAGCKWVPEACQGVAAESCDPDYCAGTPGCSWGAPQPRCGGERTSCYMLPPADCTAPGCSMRTCDVPDGWGGIDRAPCDKLTATACSKAAGCALMGDSCRGFTTCASQTNASICAMLECESYDVPTCGGYTTTPCEDLSIEDCRLQPGCHLEW